MGAFAEESAFLREQSDDGFFVEDYEFLNPNSALDECNGRYGVTPDYPDGTYYYVMTDNWPYIPRCFYGTVIDNTFRIGPNCPESTAEIDCSEEVVSIIEVIDQTHIFIRPNPSSSTLQIYGFDHAFHREIDRISIYDTSGKVWIAIDEFQEYLDISNLASGAYFLQINFTGGQVTKKIMVQ